MTSSSREFFIFWRVIKKTIVAVFWNAANIFFLFSKSVICSIFYTTLMFNDQLGNNYQPYVETRIHDRYKSPLCTIFPVIQNFAIGGNVTIARSWTWCLNQWGQNWRWDGCVSGKNGMKILFILKCLETVLKRAFLIYFLNKDFNLLGRD